MHSKTKNTRDIRKTVDFDLDLFETIDQMRIVKNCSFSYVCYVLLQYAVKEKQRKRKNRNEGQPGHMGEGNSQ